MLIVSIDWQWWRHHLSVFALCLVAYLINLVEKPYLSQAAKCICLELLNVIFSDCKIYLSQLISCICLKLQNVFVSNCKIHLPVFAFCLVGHLINAGYTMDNRVTQCVLHTLRLKYLLSILLPAWYLLYLQQKTTVVIWMWCTERRQCTSGSKGMVTSGEDVYTYRIKYCDLSL